MPFNLNVVHLAGTLTREPEIKYTPSGTAIAQVSLAINRVYYKNEGKEKVEEVTFVEAEAWGRTAEVIQEHVHKGHTIYLEGRLKLDQWDDKESGKKRSKLRIVVEEFKFVSSPRTTSGGEYDQTQKPQRPKQSAKPPADPDLDEDDQIPFE